MLHAMTTGAAKNHVPAWINRACNDLALADLSVQYASRMEGVWGTGVVCYRNGEAWMKRGVGIVIVVLVALAIAIVACVRLGVFRSAAQGGAGVGRSIAPGLVVDESSVVVGRSWGFPILFPSVEQSDELFHDWARFERESGYSLVQIYGEARGRTAAFKAVRSTADFLALALDDFVELRFKISPTPDLATVGLAWDTARAELLLRYLRTIGVEGTEHVNPETLAADLSSGREFILDVRIDPSRRPENK